MYSFSMYQVLSREYHIYLADMDTLQIDEQLQQCSTSLTNVTNQLNESETDSNEYHNLIQARFSLIDAIISLNIMRESLSPLISNKFISGSLCIAPRLYDGSYDIAIIMDFLPDTDLVTVIWMRPRNKYELKSLGTSLPATRVKEYSDTQYKEESRKIAGIEPGSFVWARYEDGMWHKAEVCRRLHAGLSQKSLSLSLYPDDDEITTNILLEVRYTEYKGSSTAQLSASISTICTRIELNRNHSELERERKRKRYEESDTEEEEEEEEEEEPVDVTDRSRRVSSREEREGNKGMVEMLQQGYILGEWERHTKGVAGRLMAKMGYKRGEGLGRKNQGEVFPVQAAKVLPPGVALDFIHEPVKKHKHQSDSQTGKRERKKERERERGWGTSSKSDSGKSNVFDFMNNMSGSDERERERERNRKEYQRGSSGVERERERNRTVIDHIEMLGDDAVSSNMMSRERERERENRAGSCYNMWGEDEEREREKERGGIGASTVSMSSKEREREREREREGKERRW